MSEDPTPKPRRTRAASGLRGILGSLSALVSAAVFVAAGLAAVTLLPGTPLPEEWNPLRPLDLDAPVTPVTRWKLGRAQTGPACLAALRTGGVVFEPLADLEESESCHIRDRVAVQDLGGIEIAPLETRCATALRLALWTRHGLGPAAEAHLGAEIARLHHLSSYSCRRIRTMAGTGGRMSLHATANAIDVTGITLGDGRRVALIDDWGRGAEGRFLLAARDAACTWFETTLGPDYNALHADHFHLQTRGWGLCR